MNRREFITISSGALAAWPVAASAQQPKRVYRIGYLALSDRVPWIVGLTDGLRELGYLEGQNLQLEWRLAAGKGELLPDMASDLVRMRVDVIVAANVTVALTAKKIASSIPVVAVATHDGVGAGLYDSLAKPGVSVTGVESLAPELDGKRIQLLKEIIPGVARLSIIYNPLDQGARAHPPLIEMASRTSNIETNTYEVRSSSDFDEKLEAIAKNRPDALLSVADPLTLSQRKRIVDFCNRHRIPNAHEIREFVQLGGLLSYGASFYGIWHRSAYYVDRILKGASPNELPVELPTVFDLALNLRSAKLLGLSIPSTMLPTADLLID
jgi:putative ABC transport system substrate-binding protein